MTCVMVIPKAKISDFSGLNFVFFNNLDKRSSEKYRLSPFVLKKLPSDRIGCYGPEKCSEGTGASQTCQAVSNSFHMEHGIWSIDNSIWIMK